MMHWEQRCLGRQLAAGSWQPATDSGGLRNVRYFAGYEALLSLQLLAFGLQQLRIQLCSNQNGDAAHIEPEHQGDYRADGAIGLVVVGKMGDIDVDALGYENPQQRSEEHRVGKE